MSILRKPTRLLAVALALALLAAGMPVARADGSFQASVSVESMSVYARKAPHALLGALPRGTVVTVEAYSGNAALIRYNGRTGIAQVTDMSPVADSQPAQQGAESSGTPVFTNRETRVYKRPSTKSGYASVGSGTSMLLLGVNGSCAKVSLDGRVGYVVYSHLSEGQPAAQEQSAQEQTSDDAVKKVNVAVVTTQRASIYANADYTGDSIAVDQGVALTLLAVRGDVAMVERGGAIGFTSLSGLQKSGSGAKAKEPKASKNPFAAGSNEYVIYSFLTGEMGYNRAAAMGVIANIKYESGYRPTCVGDGGTSYGICQWHAGRKTNLINYCSDNGLDYTMLDAQLKFFKYEITSRYASVHSYLKQVEDSAEGAYDAGYYFCFNYEAPAARTSQSTKRGSYARDTLYGM